ncbi:aldehyde reductase II [Pseudohyphozyma bogoriensis]|nr:aldehyde reductase II [Pseudohyphozyma bogoriensis]
MYPGTATVGEWLFCEKHLKERCDVCSVDYRGTNNDTEIEVFLESWPREERELVLEDKLSPTRRPILQVADLVRKSADFDEDGDDQYECKLHSDVECEICLDWTQRLFRLVGLWERHLSYDKAYINSINSDDGPQSPSLFLHQYPLSRSYPPLATPLPPHTLSLTSPQLRTFRTLPSPTSHTYNPRGWALLGTITAHDGPGMSYKLEDTDGEDMPFSFVDSWEYRSDREPKGKKADKFRAMKVGTLLSLRCPSLSMGSIGEWNLVVDSLDLDGIKILKCSLGELRTLNERLKKEKPGCQACGETGKMLHCGTCFTHYCTTECQIKDWKEGSHKKEFTGGNGHVGQHVVDQLLAHPARPKVRTTVRSGGSADELRKHFKNERLEVVLISDILQEGAFDEAMKSVTHVAHVASPLVIGAKDIKKELLDPAIQGTLGLVKSAAKTDTVKSVVTTSSFGTVFDPTKGWRPGHTYTSDEWFAITYEKAGDPNFDLDQYPAEWKDYITYCASKVLAEEAVWDFKKTNSPSFSLATILPTYIGGPVCLPGAKLSWSQQLLINTAKDYTLPALDYPNWVDVRDVAKAHVNALDRGASGRWIVSANKATFETIADVVRANFPQLSPSSEKQLPLDGYYNIDSKPALEASGLGLGEYISLEKTVVDTVKQALEA